MQNLYFLLIMKLPKFFLLKAKKTGIGKECQPRKINIISESNLPLKTLQLVIIRKTFPASIKDQHYCIGSSTN